MILDFFWWLCGLWGEEVDKEDLAILFIISGSDLLSRVLRQSTISVTGFNDRVRNGIGWDTCAIATREDKQNECTSNL